MKKRIFIVEDQRAVSEGIAESINREADLSVCGEADDAQPALAAIQTTKPDLVLVDMRLKSSNGMDLIRALQKLHPALLVVAMTMFDPVRYEQEARAAGANEFVVKQEGLGRVMEVIRSALK